MENNQEDLLENYVQLIGRMLEMMQSDPELARSAVESGVVQEMRQLLSDMLRRFCDSIDADIEAGKVTDSQDNKQYMELRAKINTL